MIDIGGTAAATAIGATSVRMALRRSRAGIVTNAAVRDVADIRALGLPVFAAGVSVPTRAGTTPSGDRPRRVAAIFRARLFLEASRERR